MRINIPATSFWRRRNLASIVQACTKLYRLANVGDLVATDRSERDNDEGDVDVVKGWDQNRNRILGMGVRLLAFSDESEIAAVGVKNTWWLWQSQIGLALQNIDVNSLNYLIYGCM